MIVLGLESSCDETAAALVDAEGRVLADVVHSQVKLHAPFGGVVPELAARAHLAAVTAVVREALARAELSLADLSRIAVTTGPGLAGALLVGVSAAKALGFAADLPVVGVDHLHAHLLAVQLLREPDDVPTPFPYVALLVSGGHTGLYRVESPTDATLLGQTRDDAAGEAFDKAAKLLGLGYPGGPRIDRLAALGRAEAHRFPTPLAGREGYEFSFAGLKTALSRHVELHGVPNDEAGLADLAAAYQGAIVRPLVERSLAACEAEGIPRLVLTGGVAANRGLRELAAARASASGVELRVPPLVSCTDNAAMVAYAGLHADLEGSLEVYTRDASRRRGRFGRGGELLSPQRHTSRA